MASNLDEQDAWFFPAAVGLYRARDRCLREKGAHLRSLEPNTVSVIVPCYNQARYLADALESILTQRHQQWECVIVNDGSSDNTYDVAAAYCARDPRFKLVEQSNKGLSAARNAGIRAAQGKLLQFLDADDTLESGKLFQHSLFLAEHAEVDIVFGDVRYFEDGSPDNHFFLPREWGTVTEPFVGQRWRTQGTMLVKLIQMNVMTVNCPLVRRSVFERVGLWDEALDALEDWEFWLRCAVAGIRFQFIDTPDSLALVRWREGSMNRDRPRIARAAFEMRLTAARYLSDPGVRARNHRLAFRCIEQLGPKHRTRRLLRLARATGTLDGLVSTCAAWIFGQHGVGYGIRRQLRNVVPWPVQKALLRLIE